jgi:hypothetical protein
MRTRRNKKRDPENNIRDLITAFAICNNVMPVLSDPNISKVLESSEEDKEKPKNFWEANN